jgi:hypothetical protein
MKKIIRGWALLAVAALAVACAAPPMQYENEAYKLDERNAVLRSCGEQGFARVCAQNVLHSDDVSPGAPRSMQSDTGGKRT